METKRQLYSSMHSKGAAWGSDSVLVITLTVEVHFIYQLCSYSLVKKYTISVKMVV